jgi:hypothetical protein
MQAGFIKGLNLPEELISFLYSGYLLHGDQKGFGSLAQILDELMK